MKIFTKHLHIMFIECVNIKKIMYCIKTDYPVWIKMREFNMCVILIVRVFELKINNLPLSAFGDLRTAELSPVMQNSFEYTVSNTEISWNNFFLAL